MKKIFNLLFISLAVILYSACTPEEEDLFDASSANRMEAALKADKDVLTSPSNGWLMEYYPSPSQTYGGYNILVSFTPDGKTTVASDVASATDKVTSTYSLKQSAGAVLSFDTHNEIMHFFSDPANPSGIGRPGKGMEGDFEFTIMEATKDKVVLMGKKNLSKIIMTPLAEGVVWADYLTKIQKNEDEMYFSDYTYEAGNVSAKAKVSYRNFKITYEKEGVTVTDEAPYIVTPTGFKFYEPLTIGGVEVSELIYKGQSGSNYEFVSADGNAKLNGLLSPINEVLISGDWYFAYSKLGAYGQQCWDLVKQGIAGENETLYFVNLHAGTQLIFGSLPIGGDSYYKGILGYDYELIGDNEIQFEFNGSADDNGGFYFTNIPGFKYILYPLIGTFELKANDPKNPTLITLQDKEEPTNTIVLSKTAIYYPDKK